MSEFFRSPEGGEAAPGTKTEPVIDNLVQQLSRLPSIGRKTAQRLAYFLLQGRNDSAERLAQAISEARKHVHACRECGNYTQMDLCPVCTNPRRQRSLVCVVEKPWDVLALERSGRFPGVYHILGGCLSPLDGVGPQELNLARLFQRVEGSEAELILALGTHAEGEATAMYIARKLQGSRVKISRLARGIPIGSDLEYVDELTMQRALEGRVDFSGQDIA